MPDRCSWPCHRSTALAIDGSKVFCFLAMREALLFPIGAAELALATRVDLAFDTRGMRTGEAVRAGLKHLFELGLLAVGDRVILTSGDTMEQHGATNVMRLLEVGPDGAAHGLGEL